MAVEGEHLQEVKEAYLRTRELINTGTNPFNPRLLEEVPECLLNMKFMEYQEEPSTGASCPDMAGSSAADSTSTDPITKEIVSELEPGSGEAKLAMIHAMLGYHKGEVRAYGGQWTLTLPDWASKKVDSQAVLALERRTHPYNMKTRWGDLMEYTEEEIHIHVVQRKRPPIDKVVGLFWARARMAMDGTGDETCPHGPFRSFWGRWAMSTPCGSCTTSGASCCSSSRPRSEDRRTRRRTTSGSRPTPP